MVMKELRKDRNWSQEQLAELSGLSLRTIQRIESGNRVGRLCADQLLARCIRSITAANHPGHLGTTKQVHLFGRPFMWHQFPPMC